MGPPSCKVVIKVHCITQLNQRVAIVGSVKSLGNWHVENALVMHTEKDIYPNWNIQFTV